MNKISNNVKTEQTKLKIIKLKLIELALVSTSHGLPSIFRTEKIVMKLMWLILFLLSTGFGIYSVRKSILDYLSYDVVTRIDVINESPTQFPAITFYNLKNSKQNISLENILFLCSFSNKCTPNDFKVIIDKLGYISYRFMPKNISQAGKVNSLKMILYNPAQADPQSHTNGFGIVVHNDSIDPGYYGGISNNEITISPGFATSISISRTYSFKLGAPYNDCIKDVTSLESLDSDLYKFILTDTKYSYTQRDCIQYCMGREVFKYYNISNRIENYFNAFLILKTIYNKTTLDFSDTLHDRMNEKCLEECPLECDSISYDVSVSFSQLMISEQAYNMYKHNLIVNYTRPYNELNCNDFVFVSIFYSNLQYTQISQSVKIGQFDLISSIGGLFGLFIGISFLSFAEILEAFIEIIYIMFTKTNKLNIQF